MVVCGLMLLHVRLPICWEGRIHLAETLYDYLSTLICMDLSKDNYHMAKRKHSLTCHSLHALFSRHSKLTTIPLHISYSQETLCLIHLRLSTGKMIRPEAAAPAPSITSYGSQVCCTEHSWVYAIHSNGSYIYKVWYCTTVTVSIIVHYYDENFLPYKYCITS